MPERPLRPTAPTQIVLGFDFGLRRIGIASGDTLLRTAAPRTTINAGPNGIDWRAIEQLLTELKPARLVVGSPRHADGSVAQLGAAADRFAAELAARTQLPVHRVDEFASSLEAAARLKQERARGARVRRVRTAALDSAAAAIILQRWLEGEEAGDD
jgi:putative holliday junction resolvase